MNNILQIDYNEFDPTTFNGLYLGEQQINAHEGQEWTNAIEEAVEQFFTSGGEHLIYADSIDNFLADYKPEDEESYPEHVREFFYGFSEYNQAVWEDFELYV